MSDFTDAERRRAAEVIRVSNHYLDRLERALREIDATPSELASVYTGKTIAALVASGAGLPDLIKMAAMGFALHGRQSSPLNPAEAVAVLAGAVAAATSSPKPSPMVAAALLALLGDAAPPPELAETFRQQSTALRALVAAQVAGVLVQPGHAPSKSDDGSN